MVGQTEVLFQRMQAYRSVGMPLKALTIFEDASPNNPEIEGARVAAVEMYLELGFAEKAQEQLSLLGPNALPRKGDLQYLNAQVLLAAGQYDSARAQMEQSLAEIRGNRIEKGLNIMDGLLRGSPFLAPSQQGLTGPLMGGGEIFSELVREAQLNFELGLLDIEMGKPKEAIKAFTASIDAYPRLIHYRPIMEFYIDKMVKAGISDAKLPPEPPIYVADDDLAIKFPPAPEPAKGAKANGDEKKPAAKRDAAKKADAPKK
jgi:tetratricopeptide (TPR) repeat protein